MLYYRFSNLGKEYNQNSRDELQLMILSVQLGILGRLSEYSSLL